MAHPGRNETDSGLRGCRSRLALILINEVPECFVREPFSVFRLFAKAARWRLPPFSNRPADQSTTPSPSPRRIRRLEPVSHSGSCDGGRSAFLIRGIAWPRRGFTCGPAPLSGCRCGVRSAGLGKPVALCERRDRVGVAGFLHGLMRSDVEIATQSMLVGANWDIAAVHVDTAGKEEPYYSPQAQVAKLYRHHHGGQRLRIETSPLPTYDQPLSMGWMHAPSGTVAFMDVMATRSAKTLYIHAVNRDGERSFPLAVDLSALPAGREASRFTWALRPEVLTAAAGEIAVTTETKLAVSDALLRTVLPPKSVSIVEIGLARE